MELNEMVKNVVLTKACSIKADKDSKESKVINLKVKFDQVTLQSVFEKALAGTVIQWQNGPGRKQYDTWMDKQVVEISFNAPGRAAQVDPITALTTEAKAAGIDVNDKRAFSEWITKKAMGLG